MVGLGVTLSCGARDFNCQDSDDCGSDGMCQSSGYCSFPDTECPSGQRYGELAGAGLAGECVNPTEGTESTGSASGTSTTSTATSTPTSTSTSTSALTGSTSVADGSSTSIEISATGSSGPASSTSSTTEGSESSSTGPGAVYSFFDDFNRADSEAVGNGWVEDNADIFSLLNGEVIIDEQMSSSYERNIVYRPLSESIADVELAAVVRFNTQASAGIPQIFARVQSDVESNMGVSAYLCFFSSSSNLVIRRNNLLEEAELAVSANTIGYDAAQDYRLRFQVEGSDPVRLTCAFEGLDAGMWSTVESVEASDNQADAIVEPGVVGFSTHIGSQPYRYDDFYAVDISLAR